MRLRVIARPVVARHSWRRRPGGPGARARAGVGQDCRHVEKRMICRECDTTVAGEMPILPIERGKPGPGLLAHIMIAKFDDHIPLPPVRDVRPVGIDISRSVMADWVGRVSALLMPLVLLIRGHIAALDRIHTDDTPVDVLDPDGARQKPAGSTSSTVVAINPPLPRRLPITTALTAGGASG